MENARGVEPASRANHWLFAGPGIGIKYLSVGRHCVGRVTHGAGQFREYIIFRLRLKIVGLNARALHIAELSGKSNRQLGKYPARSAARRTARPCVQVRAPYYPSLFLPSFIASRAAGNIRCRQMP